MGPSQAGYALSQTVPLHSSLEKGGAISPPFSQTANFVAAPPYATAPLRGSFATPQSGDITDPRVGCATGTTSQRQAAIAACPPIRDTTNPRVGCAPAQPHSGKPLSRLAAGLPQTPPSSQAARKDNDSTLRGCLRKLQDFFSGFRRRAAARRNLRTFRCQSPFFSPREHEEMRYSPSRDAVLFVARRGGFWKKIRRNFRFRRIIF